MKTFDFIQITDAIYYNRQTHSYAAIPSPDNNYEATLTNYISPNTKNVEIRINPMSHNIRDKVCIYIRQKGHKQYAVFNYKGCVDFKIKETDGFRYVDILNIHQITTELEKSWDQTKPLIP